MLLRLIFWFSATIFTVFCFQYIVNYDRVEVSFYAKPLVRDPYFKFGRYNRTNYCLNASFYLLEDLFGNIEGTSTVYRMSNNEYKSLGIEFKYNACEYFETDMHGFSSLMKQYGHLEACNPKKGHYYVYNFMPDESVFPKVVPLGNYKLELSTFINRTRPLLIFAWYVDVEFKLNDRKFGR